MLIRRKLLDFFASFVCVAVADLASDYNTAFNGTAPQENQMIYFVNATTAVSQCRVVVRLLCDGNDALNVGGTLSSPSVANPTYFQRNGDLVLREAANLLLSANDSAIFNAGMENVISSLLGVNVSDSNCAALPVGSAGRNGYQMYSNLFGLSFAPLLSQQNARNGASAMSLSPASVGFPALAASLLKYGSIDLGDPYVYQVALRELTYLIAPFARNLAFFYYANPILLSELAAAENNLTLIVTAEQVANEILNALNCRPSVAICTQVPNVYAAALGAALNSLILSDTGGLIFVRAIAHYMSSSTLDDAFIQYLFHQNSVAKQEALKAVGACFNTPGGLCATTTIRDSYVTLLQLLGNTSSSCVGNAYTVAFGNPSDFYYQTPPPPLEYEMLYFVKDTMTFACNNNRTSDFLLFRNDSGAANLPGTLSSPIVVNATIFQNNSDNVLREAAKYANSANVLGNVAAILLGAFDWFHCAPLTPQAQMYASFNAFSLFYDIFGTSSSSAPPPSDIPARGWRVGPRYEPAITVRRGNRHGGYAGSRSESYGVQRSGSINQFFLCNRSQCPN